MSDKKDTEKSKKSEKNKKKLSKREIKDTQQDSEQNSYDSTQSDQENSSNVARKPRHFRTNPAKHQTFMEYINSCDKLNVISVLVTIIAVITMAYIGIDECKRCFYEMADCQVDRINQTLTNHQLIPNNLKNRKYWTYFRKEATSTDARLKHVYRVLDAFGYHQETPVSGKDISDISSDWDLLWAFDYPFVNQYARLKNLKPHQKVNHLPGCGYITTKVELSTTPLKYILPAFKLPSDKEKFLNFTEKHPKKKYVIKDNEHRHIKVKSLEEIKTEGHLNTNGSFVQEFLDKPLLVSGHMFDIGIYTIITSVDPLRIYIYNGDVLLRFCPQKLKPFDPNNLDKYVVGDDYLPIWEVEKIQYWYKKLGYGMRDSLNAYLADDGRDGTTIWRQIEEAIGIAIHSKQSKIVEIIKRFKSKRNFFELMRFDFLVDEKLNVFLLEANMSPNLSSAHFKPNQLLYEQVLFNLFGLIGLGDRVTKSVALRSLEDIAMETSEKNIMVLPNLCSSALCRNNCDDLDCRLCKACLAENKELEQDLREAHKEHINRGDCKRIFPPTMVRLL